MPERLPRSSPAPLPRAGRRRRAARALAMLALLALAGGGCAGPERAADAAGASAEFLVAGGDSTYWIAADAPRPRVRAAPLLLARWDGRLHEIYAVDDDRSFFDALFTSQRIFRRDLVEGDSLLVFDDPSIPRLAERYAVTHPDERPLELDEDAAPEPSTVASSEVALLEVHGPYLSVEHRADVEQAGPGHRHAVRRLVLDLRTGRATSLAALFGDEATAALVGEGRRRFAAATDSLGRLAVAEDTAVARRARRALGTLRFDPGSFNLTAVGRAPAVVFVAVGREDDARAVALALAPVPVPAPAPRWWRAEVAGTLPSWSPDSSEARWSLGTRALHARVQDARATLVLVDAPPGDPGRDPTGRGAAGRDEERRQAGRTIAQLPTPLHQLFRLDAPALSPRARRALRRAFDESALYDETATSAAWPSPRSPQRPRARAARLAPAQGVPRVHAVRLAGRAFLPPFASPTACPSSSRAPRARASTRPPRS